MSIIFSAWRAAAPLAWSCFSAERIGLLIEAAYDIDILCFVCVLVGR